MSLTQIWTSEVVQESLSKLRMGINCDLSCFYERDIELKNANLLFKLSAIEVEEFNKCSEDIIYFVEKYCRFLTDKGRMPVKLREYQKNMLRILTDEHYIKNLDEYGPKNRNLILCQSRQTGKCLFGSEITIILIDVNKQIILPINFLYYLNKSNLTFIEKIKFYLMIMYYKIEKW